MQRTEFDELVRRIESRYAGRPRALVRRAYLWFALSAAGIVAAPALLLAGGLAALACGFFVVPAHGVWLALAGSVLLTLAVVTGAQLLLVDVPPPEGRRLKAWEAPSLEHMLVTLSRQLKCPNFDEVQFTLDVNASVLRVPRRGIFGGARTYLQIGLPLLYGLSAGEFRAVMAHEFAHLSAGQGRPGGWVVDLHRNWEAVFPKLRAPIGAAWLWARFHAYACVLSRGQEWQADGVAASLEGADISAAALWRVQCVSSRLHERFWLDYWARADHAAEPPEDLTAAMQTCLAEHPDAQEQARIVERALVALSDTDDSHPAFRERAAALGQTADSFRRRGYVAAAYPSSATVYLGEALAAIERDLVNEWRGKARAAWQDRYRKSVRKPQPTAPANVEIATAGGSLPQAIDGSAAASPVMTSAAKADTTVGKLWKAACETASLHGLIAAESQLRELLAQYPEHLGARAMLGALLSEAGRPGGEQLLEEVIAADDEQWTAVAYQALANHCRLTGQTARLTEVRRAIETFDKAVVAGRRERSTVGPGDPLDLVELDADRLRAVRELLDAESGCAAAWLAQKRLVHFPSRRLFVFCVRGPGRWWPDAAAEQAMVQRLTRRVELPGQLLLIGRHGAHRKLARRVAALDGAEIFRRD